MELVQIVPYLPPRNSGVGDYALHLARALYKTHDLRTTFLVCDPDNEQGSVLEDFPVVYCRQRNAVELDCVLSDVGIGQAKALLLHYVGYGYQKRGCPLWLVAGLERFLSKQRCRVVTMFHELFATGPVWASSFWTSPVQRWIARSLARMSATSVTNREQSRAWLSRSTEIEVGSPALPVISNFGELTQNAALRGREPQAVFFGGFGRTIKDPHLGWSRIERACQAMDIRKLIIAGRDKADRPSSTWLEIRQTGVLSAEAASALLAASRVGFLDYFDGYLGKSSFFAAYCSHGIVPVLLAPNDSELDGLHSHNQFLIATELPNTLELAEQQRISEAAFAWYSLHDVKRTAGRFATACLPLSSHPPDREHAGISVEE
jgi:hypothetical protein